MKQNIFLRFAQFRFFWRARRSIERIKFFAVSSAYKTHRSIEDLGNDGRSLRGIIRVTATPFIRAILVAATLQLTNSCVSQFFAAHHLEVPNDSDYVTFLAAISSIGSVFIGLYYAAIATVGSAIYARVPSNLRDLLAQDRFGIVYMRFLSFLTYLCLTLICLRLSSFPRVYLAPPLITLAAGVGVFAFVKLGQRVFHLFDPAELSSHIFEQLHRWMKAVTTGRFRWQDKSFQNHAYKQAERAVAVLETLRDLLLKEQHLNGTPLLELAKRTTGLLVLYRKQKTRIPTSSRWYPQIYSFPDWYRTDDMRLSVATESGTTIEPKNEVSRDWLEERLVTVLMDCLVVNVGNEQWVNALAALQCIELYAETLAEHGRADLAFLLFQQASSRTVEAMTRTPQVAQPETIEKIAVAEKLASIPITLSLAARKRYESLKRIDVIARIESIDWSNPRTYYEVDFEEYVLYQIEYLAPRLAFERAVEGKEISPSWYLAELAMQPEANHLVENIDVMINKIPASYVTLRKTFSDAKLHWMTAATLSRQWEYWHKVTEQVSVWERAWLEVSEDRKLKDLPWPKLDIASIPASLHALKTELLKAMSTLQMQLSILERPTTYPDYAGQFLHSSGEAVLEALIGGDIDLLQSVFPKYFGGCIFQFLKMRPTEGPRWLMEQNLRIAAAAVLDLMDVSGYALLLSELGQEKAMWSVVRRIWERHLSDSDSLKVIAATVGFVESGIGIEPRGVLRTMWQQRVKAKFAQLPRKQTNSEFWQFDRKQTVLHPSPLVRVVASRPTELRYEGIDIFIALYLAPKEGAEQLRAHWKRNNLTDELSGERYDFDNASNAAEQP